MRPRDPFFLRAGALFVAVFAALLFTHLGHYALWDDEANTGLFAKGVWHTGDTSAVMGHNIVAYRNGLELRGLHNRLIAPLSYYVDAPFSGLGGTSALAVRLPFALLGLTTFVLALYWLWRRGASRTLFVLTALGFIGNVSFILYCRQGRYYALSSLLTLLTAYFYVERDGSRRRVVGLCVSAGLLMATHYIAYAGLGVGLGVDYLLFGWRTRRYSWRAVLAVLLSQAAVAAVVVGIWYPLGKAVTGYVPQRWWVDKLTLWAWNLRDLNLVEYVAGVVLVLSPVVYFLRRRQDPMLLRIPVGIAAYAIGIAAFSPQPVGWAHLADIRYMQATIPALIFLTARMIDALPEGWLVPKLGLAAVLFFTNVVNVPMQRLSKHIPEQPKLQSTFLQYLGELRHPPVNPYASAAAWVNANVAAEQSIYVVPEFAIYPLMFHAPKAVYAWQFDGASHAAYPQLPPIHFKGEALPDYFIAFGGEVAQVRGFLGRLAQSGIRYEEAASLPVAGKDMTRPELFWRSFTQVAIVNPRTDGIYIYRRVP